MTVESQFIRLMSTFHFPVLAQRCDLNAVICNAPLKQGGFKQRPVLWLGHKQRVCKLRAIVRLDHPDGKESCANQVQQKNASTLYSVVCLILYIVFKAFS